jgi:hypothetical protein
MSISGIEQRPLGLVGRCLCLLFKGGFVRVSDVANVVCFQ